jgi:sulfane dehydrogenase subunit SoxC
MLNRFGHIVRAPENFIDPALAQTITQHGTDGERRSFLRQSFLAALAGGSAAVSRGAGAADTGPSASATMPEAGDPAILTLPPHSKALGQPVAQNPYGQPSRFENRLLRRESPGLTRVAAASVSFTPLQGLFGIITPNGLHFERHHQGWHDIDPAGHRLMIHGLVKQAKIYTMDDLMRLPSVSRIHFIECGANTATEWGNVAVPTVQYTHGMLSCCEFTGVPLSLVLNDCGIDRKTARFVLAEGADGSSMTRTIAIERALDDVLVAYGMNGEMLRPENGYPLRLVVPGVQGVSWVKWLRRIKVGDAPWNAKDETLHYVDLQPGGLHRQYTSIQECKSVITTPSGGQQMQGHGFYDINGLAWSGRGKIKQVDVSVDGGRNWRTARLDSPVLSKCLTRFHLDWVWHGEAALLQSRAIDETGYVQPKLAQLRQVRGSKSIYHNNAIQTWQVSPNGEVSNVQID